MKYSIEMKIYRARCRMKELLQRASKAVGEFLAWYNDFEYGDIEDE